MGRRAEIREECIEKVRTQPVEILLAEDNPGDIRLTMEALQESELNTRLKVARDGVEALDYLRRTGASRPDLILLDLNLPRKGGAEVLAEIKSDPMLRCIPAAVLTMSDDEEDVARSYYEHANCYIRKPLDLDQFVRVVDSVKEFWFSTVTLPPHNDVW